MRCTISGWAPPPENAKFTKSRILGKVWRSPEFFGGRNSKIPVSHLVRLLSVYECAKTQFDTTQRRVHAIVSAEAHNAKMPKFTNIWYHPLAATMERVDRGMTVW